MQLMKASGGEYVDLIWLVQAAVTRFSSTYNCMLSVLRLETAFKKTVQKHNAALTGKDATEGQKSVVAIINREKFWTDPEVLVPLAKPYDEVGPAA